MMVDGKTFWNRVDFELGEIDKTLMDLSKATKIVYGTMTDSRKRGALPKAEIIFKISRYLNVSVDKLLVNSEPSPMTKRIDRIRRACLVASEEDLILVERILRIDGKNAFDNLAKPYTLRTK